MTSAEPEDIALRLGLLDSERDVVRELWFRPVALDVFVKWLDGCEAVRRFRPEDPTSPDFCSWTVRAPLGITGERFVLSLSTHDAGVLHEIAEHARLDGVASLMLDGESFTGDAPFFVFTERVPGRANRSLHFDPLRGLTSNEAEIDSLLREHMGGDFTLERLIRHGAWGMPHELVGWVKFVDEGRVLQKLEWKPVQSPSRQWLVLVALSIFALAVPTFFASMANGVEFGPVLFSVIFVSWMTFVPLRFPLVFRAAWFVALPSVWSLLVMFVRAR